MVELSLRVEVWRHRDVIIIIYENHQKTLLCLIRPEKTAAQIEATSRSLYRMTGATWFSRLRVSHAMRKLGRTWEGVQGVNWSETLAVAIAEARDVLEELDLASAGPLDLKIRDEYDDVIFAVMAKILAGGTDSLLLWIQHVYDLRSSPDIEMNIGDALARVEELLVHALRP